MDLFDQKIFKSIGKLVDVCDPSKPRFHVGNRDRESSTDHNREHQDPDNSECLRDFFRGGSNCAENCRHRESSDKSEEVKCEKICQVLCVSLS
jgi:hypothetical protein